MKMSLRAKGILLLTVILTGCVAGGDDRDAGGSAGGGSGGNSAELTGVFQAGGVAGLRYATTTGSGATDAAGTFKYRAGESVKFSIGAIELGSAPGAASITPFSLTNVVPPATEEALRAELDRATREASDFRRAVNIQQLLVALDADHDALNGLDVGARANALANAGIDFDLGVAEFASRVQRLAPDLTRGIPASRSLAMLYRSLNIQVSVQAATLAVTSDDKSSKPSLAFKTYRADGSRATEGEDQDNDGDPETLRAWTYNSQGRVASEDVRSPTADASQKQRYQVEYQYDARGAVIGGQERLDADGDGNFDVAAQRVAQVDAYGFRTGLRIDRDQGVDGTVDARDIVNDQYDARHNRVRSVTQTAGADSRTSSVNTQSMAYDGSDRKVSDETLVDSDGDGIADNHVQERLEYQQGAQPTRRISEQDFNGDGVADLRFVTTSQFDAADNEVARVQEFDDGADGVIDRIQHADFTYDEERRLITQQFHDDFGADGVVDSKSRIEATYDAAGHLVSQASEFDFDNDGVIDNRITTVASGTDSDLKGYQNTSYGDAGDPLYRTDTVVASKVYADGVLLLAQQYFGY